MENLSGKQLGPYQVVGPLGEGGMAAVYKAYQPSMERYVALKILPDRLTNKFEFMKRFEQEAKILAQLQHPHILPVFDYGEADDHPYIVMPLLKSGDLTDVMSGQPLPLDLIRQIISQVGDALDYAHQRALVHRDVKPSNVLLDERGNCLLTDFGIAKIIEGAVPLNLTTEGAFIGTPSYMSPEQGAGKKLDGRSDIYALGIMLYEMTTGRIPYRAETPMAVVIKHINDPLPMPHKLNPTLPEVVEGVILKALAKQPEDRYATAGDMVKALRAAIPETDVTRPVARDRETTDITVAGPALKTQEDDTLVLPSSPPRSQGGLLLALLAGGVAIIIIGAVIFFAFGGNRQGVDGDAPVAELAQVTAEPAEEANKTSAPGDLTLYDDFDNPIFEGEWNKELWTPGYNFNGTTVEQNNGILSISRYEPEASGLSALTLSEWQLDEVTSVEVKVKLDADIEASNGEVGMIMSSDIDDNWWSFGCSLGHADHQAAMEGWAVCEPSGGEPVEVIPIQLDTWYTFRFEIDAATAIISSFMDNQKMGDFVPTNPERLKAAKFDFDLKVYSEDGALVSGHFDNVRVAWRK